MNEQLITVEVAYALPSRQCLLEIHVAPATDVQTCIQQSGILEQFPEIDLTKNKVGIWSRTCKLGDSVKQGDRIEIYRPLIADPKEIRRRRAEKAKDEGRANKITGGRAKSV